MNLSNTFPEWLRALAGVSTVAAGLAWLATVFLRRQSAAWRHLVWLLALCAPLLALPLGWIHLRVAIPILPRSSERAAAHGGGTEQPVALQSPEFPLAGAAAGTSSPASPSTPGLRLRFCLPVKLWTGIWFLGAVVVGLRLLFAHRRLKRLVRDSSSPAPPDLFRHLHDVKQDFQFAGAVRLRVGPLTEIPFCQGVFRSTIHFPEGWRQWDEERIKICLSHELAHLIRRDLLTLLAGQLACLLCWFNPLVWFALARLRREAERSADDLVLGRNIAPAIYAAHLVAVAEHCRFMVSAFSGIAFAMTRRNRLTSRVEAILDPGLRRRSPNRTTAVSVGLLALGALVAVLSVRLTAAPGDDLAGSQGQDLARMDLSTRDEVLITVSEDIEHGDIQAVEMLLKRGLDANAILDLDASLLYVAVDDRQPDIVRLLLSKEADVNRKTSWGDTPLRRACWRGYREIADTLIRAGATADPLLYATGMGDLAGLEARDKEQPVTAKEAREAIGFAVASGHPDTFGFLWKKLGPLDDTVKGKLLADLYVSAGEWGQPDMLPVLETLGAAPGLDGPRALTRAVGRNHPETVRALLERGVPLELSSNENRLRNAAGEGRLEIVRLLLDHGADINAQDGQGFTPLSWAAYNGKEDVCLLLLERGADGRIMDHDGRNAAWHAAGGAHCPRALDTMLKQGVGIGGEDKNGATILGYVMNFLAPHPGKLSFPGKVYSTQELRDYEQREQQVVDLLDFIADRPRFSAQVPVRQRISAKSTSFCKLLPSIGLSLSAIKSIARRRSG